MTIFTSVLGANACATMRRWILPVAVRGNRIRDVNLLRPLEVGQPLLAVREQIGLADGCPAATTAAATSSPHVLCGTPKHTASATAGCVSSTSSISRGEIFSPPRLIISFSRPASVR